jgi:hypothetical protein
MLKTACFAEALGDEVRGTALDTPTYFTSTMTTNVTSEFYTRDLENKEVVAVTCEHFFEDGHEVIHIPITTEVYSHTEAGKVSEGYKPNFPYSLFGHFGPDPGGKMQLDWLSAAGDWDEECSSIVQPDLRNDERRMHSCPVESIIFDPRDPRSFPSELGDYFRKRISPGDSCELLRVESDVAYVSTVDSRLEEDTFCEAVWVFKIEKGGNSSQDGDERSGTDNLAESSED